MLERLAIYTVIGVLLVGLAGTWHKNRVERAVEATRSSLTQNYSTTYVEGLEASLKASNKLLAASIKEKETLENEKTSITSQHKSVVAGLQHRATRAETKLASTNITATPVVQTCTGRELSREDAEFLAGEAARAERIVKERDYYYGEYERARQAVEAHKRELDRLNGEVSNFKLVP